MTFRPVVLVCATLLLIAPLASAASDGSAGGLLLSLEGGIA